MQKVPIGETISINLSRISDELLESLSLSESDINSLHYLYPTSTFIAAQ